MFSALAAAAGLMLPGLALAQAPKAPAKPAPSAEQIQSWGENLASQTMAANWLRRCPTEPAFRQRASQTLEQILAEFFHADGMTEALHQQAKKEGRAAAMGPCTDTAKAKYAAATSAQAFIILTAKYGVDDGPCDVAAGRAFAVRPDEFQVRAEIARAKQVVGSAAAGLVKTGEQIHEEFADPKVCEIKRGWPPIILTGWRDMFTLVQDFDRRVKTQDYGHQNSWIWRVEGHRGTSGISLGGGKTEKLRDWSVYVPCRTHTPTLDQMVSHYDCELKVLQSNQQQLFAEVGPACDDAKCLKAVRAVELRLYKDAKAAEPLQTFAGRRTSAGVYTFDANALTALLDPAQPAQLAQVTVAGQNVDGKRFDDGFPLRGSPPGFAVRDFQDGYSWTFAPET